MKFQCKVCGHEDEYTDAAAAAAAACPSCGIGFQTHPPTPVKTRIAWVELRGDNGLVVRIKEDGFCLTRGFLTNMFGPSADVVSRTGQCRFRRQDDATWLVAHCDGATNPTKLDGAPLTTETVLEEGMTISIGGFSLQVAFAWE